MGLIGNTLRWTEHNMQAFSSPGIQTANLEIDMLEQGVSTETY